MNRNMSNNTNSEIRYINDAAIDAHNGTESEYRQSGNGRRRKYRVKSKFRFITSLVIVFALLFTGASFVAGNYESIALTNDEVVTEYVDQGETLWTIAKKYKSDKTDIRKAVFKICKANDINAEELQSGMVLVIPDSI